MNRLIVLIAISLIVFSGCVQAPEEKAMLIADSTPEIKLFSKLFDSFENVDKCTAEEMYAILLGEGMELPELSDDEKAGFNKTIVEMKKCKPSLSKTVAKESESIYVVSYLLEFGDDCILGDAAAEESFDIKVNIETGKAENVDEFVDASSLAEAEEIMDTLGNCTAVVFFGAMGGVEI